MWTVFSLACGATPVWRSLCEVYIILSFYALYGFCDSAYNIIYIQKSFTVRTGIDWVPLTRYTDASSFCSIVRGPPDRRSKTSFTCTCVYFVFEPRGLGVAFRRRRRRWRIFVHTTHTRTYYRPGWVSCDIYLLDHLRPYRAFIEEPSVALYEYQMGRHGINRCRTPLEK